MKLAMAGKGGSGKTSLAGTMARLLARSGHRVLAIDGDSNPNLALTLGVPAEQMSALPTLATDLLRRGENGAQLTRTLPEITAAHAVTAPDGVELLVMAQPTRAGTGCLSRMHGTVRRIVEAAPNEQQDVCLLDTEASSEQFSRGVASFAELMLAVVEPYFKSMESARRMAALAADLGIPRFAVVANKLRYDQDLETVRAFCSEHGLEVAGAVPFDPAFATAERLGVAPVDHAPDAPAIAAIGELAEHCYVLRPPTPRDRVVGI